MTNLEQQDACQLTGLFAIMIQILMAMAAVMSLLYKRSIEHPPRPLLIWALDTSKQAIAASIVHFTNILLAYLSSLIPKQSPNPCVWYFLNLLLDCTIGVYLLYMSLNFLNRIGIKYGITGLEMGQYGNPPSFWRWLKQLFFFLLAWSFVKTIVGLALYYIPIFSIFATWVLSPFAESEEAQIIFVMFVFPLCMNILQAWLIDKVIKGKVVTYTIVEDRSGSLEDNEVFGVFSELSPESIRSSRTPSDYEAQ